MSPASTSSTLFRRHPSDLQPLEIDHPAEYERRLSSQSTTTLPSPSLVAARAYLLQQTPPIGQNWDALQRRRSLFDVQHIPRRRRVLAPSREKSGQPTINVSPLHEVVQVTRDAAIAAPADVRIKVEEKKHDQLGPVKASKSAENRKRVEDEICHIWLSENLKVPFQFSHDHLREWGREFLASPATADAFVNAVSLRRPSLTLENSEVKSPTNLVTIRARVVPKTKDRKPVLITKQFDIEGLRAGIPPMQHKGDERPVFLRRSSRARRSSMQHMNTCSRRGSTDAQMGMQSLALEKASIPIRKCRLCKRYSS